MSEAAPGGEDNGLLVHEPDAAMPGWWTWQLVDPQRFNNVLGGLRVRLEGSRSARMRLVPARRHTNLADNVHGGALMTLIDVAMFATCRMHGLFAVGRAITIDCSIQFIAAARLGTPLDVVPEILRDTGRLVFLRGLAVQADAAGQETTVASFTGTLRKPPRAQ